MVNFPSVEDHVEEKPPYFTAFIRPVDEDGFDGHRTGWVHLSHHHRVISEKSQLENQ